MKKVRLYGLLLLAVICGFCLVENNPAGSLAIYDHISGAVSVTGDETEISQSCGSFLSGDYTAELGKKLQENAFTLPSSPVGITFERAASLQVTRIKDSDGNDIPADSRLDLLLTSKYFSPYIIGQTSGRFEFPADYYIYTLRHIII